jgi:hypothetical protein
MRQVWDEALDIAAAEIGRVRNAHSNEAIFGGSYGRNPVGQLSGMTVSQLENPIQTVIPVARIGDMLRNPGQSNASTEIAARTLISA